MNKELHITKCVNALLDEGSDRTFLDHEIAKELGLSGEPTHLKVQGAGGVSSSYQAIRAPVNLRSTVEGSKLDRRIIVTIIPNPVGTLCPVTWETEKLNWEHLKKMPAVQLVPGGVQMLIGGSEADLMAPAKGTADLIGPPGGPVARFCRLGWSVAGPTCPKAMAADLEDSKESEETDPNLVLLSAQVRKSVSAGLAKASDRLFQEGVHSFVSYNLQKRQDSLDVDLNELVLAQMRIEATPNDEDYQLSKDDRHALHQMATTMKRLSNGQYQVGALWKKGEPCLPNNYLYALSRHYGFLRSKSMQNPACKQGVIDTIQEWMDKGYVRKVPPTECRPPDANYLPVFVVIKETSDTTKYRLVVDGKAVYKNASLNKSTLTGPVQIRDVILTLTRFRKHSVAIIADVAQMFLRVLLDPKDRQYHRFFWHPDPEAVPDEYEFCVHCFGNAGSPAVAISVIRDHAKKNQKLYPEAAETILESTHVDDTLDSFTDSKTAIRVCKDLHKLYGEIGMDWKKLASNSSEVMAAFNQDDWAKGYELIGPNQEMSFPTLKALGILWHTGRDDFSFPDGDKVGLAKKAELDTTKRSILRQEARLFDPLGFISPIIIAAKMILQKCWAEGKGWDDPVPDSIRLDWEKWVEGAALLPDITLPRVLIPDAEKVIKTVQLHCFSDASKHAYATVIYCRTQYADDSVYINIVASRARLAPLNKATTIPRMELEAAKLGAQLTKPLADVLKYHRHLHVVRLNECPMLDPDRHESTQSLRIKPDRRDSLVHQNRNVAVREYAR